MNSQSPGYDPNTNADKIYFTDDQGHPMYYSNQQLRTNQQPLANQLAVASQQGISNQQQVANQWRAENQQSLEDIDRLRNPEVSKEKSVISLDGSKAALTNFGINLMKVNF